jgi:hypothetical protein
LWYEGLSSPESVSTCLLEGTFLYGSHVNMTTNNYIVISVAEPHHFYAAPDPAPGENFDATLDPAAPAPTLLYSKAKFLKLTKL